MQIKTDARSLPRAVNAHAILVRMLLNQRNISVATEVDQGRCEPTRVVARAGE